ncbi:MAG: EamA family transporter RarD [Bacteroidales bacterium]|nr:EamA family transporter RarD [Bacteroidales bacterium]
MSLSVQQQKLYKSGLVYALISYGIWGIFPLYWKMLLHVPPQQILAHRVIWSLIFLFLMLVWRRDRIFLQYLSSPKILGTLLLSGALIGGNWFTYIYAVNNNHIVDASLGYYINPMVNVLLGVVFMKERLSRIQIIAVAFAFAGVAYLTFHYGRIPILSLVLAFSFGLYGLIRKKANLQSMPGLMVETLLLAPVALWYLWHVNTLGTGSFGYSSRLNDILLMLGGPVTAIPLFWFGIAATRIPLSTLGFIQYLSPTIQLLIGIFVFSEHFDMAYMISFGLVWVGLGIYTYSVILTMKQRKKA